MFLSVKETSKDTAGIFEWCRQSAYTVSAKSFSGTFANFAVRRQIITPLLTGKTLGAASFKAPRRCAIYSCRKEADMENFYNANFHS